MPRRSRSYAMRGGAWYNFLWDGIKSAGNAINDVAKKTKIASTLLDAAGYKGAAAGARALGYGKRRRQAGGRRAAGGRRKMAHI